MADDIGRWPVPDMRSSRRPPLKKSHIYMYPPDRLLIYLGSTIRPLRAVWVSELPPPVPAPALLHLSLPLLAVCLLLAGFA